VIPDRDFQRLVRAAPEGTEVLHVPGGGHSDLTEFPLYRTAIEDFLERRADSGSPRHAESVGPV
jgi:hypothetical protein